MKLKKLVTLFATLALMGCLANVSFAGLSDDAKHEWPGIVDVKSYIIAMLDEPFTTVVIEEGSAPSTPVAGEGEIYAGTDKKIYWINSDGSVYLLSESASGGETFTTVCKFGTIAASTDDERPIFVAPFDCTITAAYLVNVAAIATSATAITTLALVDKSSAGASSNTIASVNNGASGTVFAAFDAVSMGTLDAAHKLLTALDTVTLKKTDSGGVGKATDEMILMLSYIHR